MVVYEETNVQVVECKFAAQPLYPNANHIIINNIYYIDTHKYKYSGHTTQQPSFILASAFTKCFNSISIKLRVMMTFKPFDNRNLNSLFATFDTFYK